MAQTIYKDSYTTLSTTIQWQSSANSSLSAFDLTSVTSVFVMSNTYGAPQIRKSSTSSSEISYPSATAGQIQIFISQNDTSSLQEGKYYYTIYCTTTAGKQYVVENDSIRLRETVNPTY